MSVSRVFAAAVTAAMVLAASTAPASAQQPPGNGAEPASEAPEQTPAGSGPVLGAGFVLEGVWLAPGTVSLGWDEVEVAASYELMYRSPDGWVLLSGREPSGGVSIIFEGSSATVGGLPEDEAEWWFAVRARNVFGVSEWSQSAAVSAPEEAAPEPLFDPFTAPTRSGIDLERLREAMATVTPGEADCTAALALNVEGVTVVDPPADLDDPDAELTVAEVVRVAGGCLIVEYVALAGRTVAQIRDLLAADPSIHAVGEPVRGMTLDDNTGAHTHTGGHHDDGGGEQWHLPQPTMTALWNGWSDETDRHVVVAVLDTGVDITHPDLDDNVAPGRPGGCHIDDGHGHGTRMAGIIAAELGGGHVAGVAPKARILPLRIDHLGLDPDDTDCTDPSTQLVPLTATEAVARAVNEGARVINMSFSWHAEQERAEVGGVPIEPGSAGRDTFELALRAASMLGVVAVASAGNCGDADGNRLTSQQADRCSEQDARQRPALYPDVIAVAAINDSGDRIDISTANVDVDVAAPGAGIRTASPCPLHSDCTHVIEGTSPAAAYVSGVVAHLLNRYPQASVGQVRRALEQSAMNPPVFAARTARGRDGDGRISLAVSQQVPTAEFGRGIVDPAGAVIALSGLVGALEPVGSAGAFRSLSAGARHTCGLRASGSVACWGLGTVVDDTPGAAFASLSSPPGGDFVCGVRLVDGAVVCWGQVPEAIVADVAGARVLDADGATAPDGRFAQVAVGDSHVCGLRPGGRVVCWGDSSSAQTEVPFGLFGASPSQRAARIVAGADHTCAITEPSTGTGPSSVVCWGEDADAQLPLVVPFAVRDVAAGAAHTCVLGQDRLVRCYGRDADGRIDAPSGEYSALWAGADHTCALRAAAGTVICWGDSGDGRLVAPAGRHRQVAAGGRHGCALSVYARVRCWGDDSDGQAPRQARLNILSLTAAGTDLLAGRFHPDVFDYTATTSETGATLRAAADDDGSRSRICADSGRRRTCA